jgi:hypothetical protein
LTVHAGRFCRRRKAFVKLTLVPIVIARKFTGQVLIGRLLRGLFQSGSSDHDWQNLTPVRSFMASPA